MQIIAAFDGTNALSYFANVFCKYVIWQIYIYFFLICTKYKYKKIPGSTCLENAFLIICPTGVPQPWISFFMCVENSQDFKMWVICRCSEIPSTAFLWIRYKTYFCFVFCFFSSFFDFLNWRCKTVRKTFLGWWCWVLVVLGVFLFCFGLFGGFFPQLKHAVCVLGVHHRLPRKINSSLLLPDSCFQYSVYWYSFP